ncbi:MAG TPA: methyltransferase [Pseudonocardiaceae bacterium]|jgi:hypothetical protein|nr:methyltransferase [Pseudonocardiaceae bacterium]
MSADPERLLALITGYWISQSIHAGVQTGILDVLDDQPRSPDDVAEATGCDQEVVSRLLRYLSGLGLVERDGDNRYTTTDTALLLRPGSNFRDLVLMYCGDLYRAWGEFGTAIRTGQTAFQLAFGAERFEFLAQNKESARRFDRAMAAVTDLVGDELVKTYDFTLAPQVIDIGGGNGSLLKKVLRAAPASYGVVVDRDHVVAQCRREFAESEFAGRLSAREGDFFQSLPTGGNVYLLARVLHDWDDDASTRLLRVCRKAMTTSAELVIVERLLPENDGTSLASIWDMHMLAITGGRERTRTEYAGLLSDAGFLLTEVRPLPLDMSVLIATPRG